ncbi:Fc.00g020650.m01.CDS01 [Cosmosporella sp. VM-42]
MSFLGMGRPQPTSEQKIAAVEGEMRMMADTYNRYVDIVPEASTPRNREDESSTEGIVGWQANEMDRLQKACQKKCVPTDYRESELNKGESVCLDRCTAKFLDTSMKISEIMQQQGQAQGGAAPSGGLF